MNALELAVRWFCGLFLRKSFNTVLQKLGMSKLRWEHLSGCIGLLLAAAVRVILLCLATLGLQIEPGSFATRSDATLVGFCISVLLVFCAIGYITKRKKY